MFAEIESPSRSCFLPRLRGSILELCLNPLAPAALAAWFLLWLFSHIIIQYVPIFDCLGAQLPTLTAIYLQFAASFLAHCAAWLIAFWLCAAAASFFLTQRRWSMLRRWFPLFAFAWLYLFAFSTIAVFFSLFSIPRIVR